MKINEVEISNFYSIKNIKLAFDQHKGITLIEGNNKDTGGSNGSGKSALIEAVVWGLFGRTIRKSTEEAMINNQERKNLVVKIRVNDDYVIERGKKPVFLKFTHKDKELTKDNATNTQAYIEEILGTNYKVFLASTVFGQQNNIEFINSTPDDKRTIIRNFLNLDELFEMRESVKTLKSNFNQGIKGCDVLEQEHKKKINKFEANLGKLNLLKDQLQTDALEKALKYTLEDIISQERANSNSLQEISAIRRKLKELQREKETLVKRMSNSGAVESCRTCGQDLPEVDTKALEKEVEEIIKVIDNNLKQVKKLEKHIQEPPISSQDYAKVVEYKNLEKEAETYEGLKKEALEDLQSVLDEKATLMSNYDIMKFWEKAFSESGIVQYVIRNILDHFNAKVNFYLSHLSQGKFFIKFDERLKETITHNNHDVAYISLSGGEKKKISLAVMLGLQELLKLSHNCETNIMFFDEVAENLDQDGLEGLYILLSEIKKDKSLFVITHNSYLKSLMDNSKTLTITKRNGISQIKK